MNYHISEQVVWMESESGVRLYNGSVGEFLSLDGTAAEIWLLITKEFRSDEIFSVLAEKYGCGNAKQMERISQEANDFLVSLESRGVVELL